MTATEKTILYKLLKTASDSLAGYDSPEFSGKKPDFFDDKIENDVTQTNFSSLQSAPEAKISAGKTSGELTLTSIAEKIVFCTRCGLCKHRTNAVPGTGPEQPFVLVVGEGPGAEEDMQGLPFVGPAGKLLDKMLASIALDRHINCYIGNIVKCRPPNNRTPLPEEANACIPFLEAQIHVLKPKMILAAGRTAGQNLLKTNASLSTLRGRFYDYNGIPLLVTYHPSALLRDESLKRPAWEDLKTFRTKLSEIAPDYAADFAKRS
ncbi:MAG: uracil-DNA glycosylase [Treponema sp.]|nr:uracil-DNA glycosylase [Treponema sp.]